MYLQQTQKYFAFHTQMFSLQFKNYDKVVGQLCEVWSTVDP